MKFLRLAAALTILLGFQAISLTHASADTCCLRIRDRNTYRLPAWNNPGFPICYMQPNDKNKTAYQALQSRHILEVYSQFLSPLHLPHPLMLVALNCQPDFHSDSPFYSSDDRALHFCYEWYNDVLQFSPKATTPEGVTRTNVITGMWAGTLLHETGHALFDMLDVPVFGREEDAADQVAAFIALQFNPDVQRTIIKGFAYFWQMAAKAGNDPPTANDPNPPKDVVQRCFSDPLCAYSDEHGTASQRLYNTLCLGYGGNRDAFKDFVTWVGCRKSAPTIATASIASFLSLSAKPFCRLSIRR